MKFIVKDGKVVRQAPLIWLAGEEGEVLMDSDAKPGYDMRDLFVVGNKVVQFNFQREPVDNARSKLGFAE